MPREGVGVEDDDERGGGRGHFLLRRMKLAGNHKLYVLKSDKNNWKAYGGGTHHGGHHRLHT